MKISSKKKDKISEQILAFLFSLNPKPVFTIDIAGEIARDKSFVKNMLFDLKKKNLVVEIKKNPKGKPYLRRLRWQLTDNTYQIYKQKQ